MKKQNSKTNKGITLISLIITIIILLVLAVVSIRLVMNGGIIEKSNYAVQRQRLEQIEEKIKIQKTELEMAKYESGQAEEITVEQILEKNGETIETVTIASGATSIPENMPAGEYYLLTPNKYASNNNVERNTSRYAKLTSRGDERAAGVLSDIYVINEKLDIYYVIEGQQGEDIVTPPEEGGGNPPPQTEMPVATVGIKAEKNSTINGEKYSSTNPIIPAGFTAINSIIEGQESSWDAEGGPEVDKGLVIRDDSGNEFVWVPVTEDISTTQYTVTDSKGTYREPDEITGIGTEYDQLVANLQRAECAENPDDNDEILTSGDFKVQLTKEYKLMAESINKYDGFYVGRFETSRNGSNPQSKRSPGTIYDENFIVTAYNSSTENDWYGLYALNKKYSTSSVQGSLMWGIQYDKMMSWMGDVANTWISGKNTNRTCGTEPNDVIKNVYDLYGNSYEWTLAAYGSDDRVYRGGNYFHGISPSLRNGGEPTGTSSNNGSRLALYVM